MKTVECYETSKNTVLNYSVPVKYKLTLCYQRNWGDKLNVSKFLTFKFQ